MRKLIHSVLGTIAALALVGGVACSRSRDANTPSSSTQTEAPAAERVNPGSGYFGSAPENTNRQAPNAIGGGPASGADSSGSSMGIEQGTGTSGTGATGTDMDMSGGGDMGGDAGPKAMPKKSDGSNGGSPNMEKGDGSEKGSGSTGGTNNTK